MTADSQAASSANGREKTANMESKAGRRAGAETEGIA